MAEGTAVELQCLKIGTSCLLAWMSERLAGQEPEVVLVEAAAARRLELDVQRAGLEEKGKGFDSHRPQKT